MSGIYISWPFCAQKCTYCNFASGVLPRELERRYAEALLGEISSHAWGWSADTLYLGGGTPSGMDTADLERLLAALRTPCSPKAWTEATIEAPPGTLSPDRVIAWRRAGINRVSLGVQSFNASELARTGRKHRACTVEEDVDVLRANGIHQINIDLIAGLPGQTEETWRESVLSALALGVPHISVYMLEVDDDSRLGAEMRLGGKRYGALDVPSDDRIADFYESAVEMLEASGIRRYEVSNFAQPGAESAHNLKYWKREPYIGFGADAHSFDGVTRSRNVQSAREYCERSERGESLVCENTLPDPVEEKFFVGLRLSEGVQADESDWLRFGATLEHFLSTGMLEQYGERLRLSRRGVMVSNEIFQEFITA